jgi:2-amino-4-hydroxy-6-hydroxymethyldihydropteridine diphosphokinase
MAGGTWCSKIDPMKVDHQACLLLGSNIEPAVHLPQAVALLKDDLTILRWSSIWESASADCCYPDYLNMAVLVTTELAASDLKQQVLRPLEARMGRVRTEDKNASRPIDLDIILFDGEVLDPTLWQQVHLAVPVAELFPDQRSQDGELLKDVARRLAASTPIRERADVYISLN